MPALKEAWRTIVDRANDPWDPPKSVDVPDDFLGSGDPWSSRESEWGKVVRSWEPRRKTGWTWAGDYLMQLQLPTMQRQYMYQPTPFEMQRASMAGDGPAYMAARDRYVTGRWLHGGGVTVNTIMAYLELAGIVNLPASFAGGFFGKLARPASAATTKVVAEAFEEGTERVYKTPKNWSYGSVRGLGAADWYGNITIRRGMSLKDELETLGHEGVHQWLSASRGTVTHATASSLQRMRAGAKKWGYKHSHLLRFTEEALAEGIATRRIGHAIGFAMQYKIKAWRLALEGTALLGTWAGAFGAGAAIADD